MEIPINNTISSYQEPGKYYTMFLAILTMITALTISAVAIYYSVAGLVAIFAAAAVPIMIMGGTLEIAKLVTAVCLHRYWQRALVVEKLFKYSSHCAYAYYKHGYFWVSI